MRYLLASLLLAAACDATLVPNDSGQSDAGQDAAVDAGDDAATDAAVEAGPVCECSTGACCDGCHVKAAGTMCGAGVTTGRCTGSYTLQNATYYQTCDGVTATGCGGAWMPDPATTINTTCNAVSSVWSCGGGGATFPEGACCVSSGHPSCT